ncbi:hypothetical protein [Clostridium lacusfryxellense]|uniref:hypothetical protein n=1 Tax=Clostridium lacusfryxellense TaxID=205328 RepID=UPI001C0DE80C|nr:hypothetical protein [Clostridium lacusfryxellense]MBU3114647.1 hypothetical protein [Clostridium lacusfryxellense]
MFFKKRKATKVKYRFEERNEYLDNNDFINKFSEELNKFSEIIGLTINADINEKLNNSFVIPLGGEFLAEYSQSYNQFLRLEEERIWKLILCDDTMECLNDTLKNEGNHTNHLALYLTNNCTSFDIKKECFGIDVRY